MRFFDAMTWSGTTGKSCFEWVVDLNLRFRLQRNPSFYEWPKGVRPL